MALATKLNATVERRRADRFVAVTRAEVEDYCPPQAAALPLFAASNALELADRGETAPLG